MSRVFVEMAETFLYHMVLQPDLGLGRLALLDLLLECVSHPDYEVGEGDAREGGRERDREEGGEGSKLMLHWDTHAMLFLIQIAEATFNVWYRLSEELLKINDHSVTRLFKTYVERLISLLCVHCQLDEDTCVVRGNVASVV